MTTAVVRQPLAPEPAPIADPGALLKLADDLVRLCREGLIEAYRDEEGITRYRPCVAQQEQVA